MKGLMIDIIGETRFKCFEEYYKTLGIRFPDGEKHFLDLKCNEYTGLCKSFNEIIGFLQPITCELYLVDESEFWCKFHTGYIDEDQAAKMAEDVLLPDEIEKKETGYYRLWWDAHEIFSDIELLEKFDAAIHLEVKAINRMKVWLKHNHDVIDWSKLDIAVGGKYYGLYDQATNDAYGNFFNVDKKAVRSLSIVLDESDGDLSVTINGQQFLNVGDGNIRTLYKYGISNIDPEDQKS